MDRSTEDLVVNIILYVILIGFVLSYLLLFTVPCFKCYTCFNSPEDLEPEEVMKHLTEGTYQKTPSPIMLYTPTRKSHLFRNGVGLYSCYSRSSDDDDPNTETMTTINEICPICLEEFGEGDGIATLECHHCYHIDCIKCWINESNYKCPMCRSYI